MTIHFPVNRQKQNCQTLTHSLYYVLTIKSGFHIQISELKTASVVTSTRPFSIFFNVYAGRLRLPISFPGTLALRASCFTSLLCLRCPFEGRLGLVLLITVFNFNTPRTITSFEMHIQPKGIGIHLWVVNGSIQFTSFQYSVFWKAYCYCIQVMIQLPHTDRQ